MLPKTIAVTQLSISPSVAAALAVKSLISAEVWRAMTNILCVVAFSTCSPKLSAHQVILLAGVWLGFKVLFSESIVYVVFVLVPFIGNAIQDHSCYVTKYQSESAAPNPY